MTKGTHVIDRYTHAKLVILCVCGWEGNADLAWTDHKKWGKDHPVHTVREPSLFEQNQRHNNKPKEFLTNNWKEFDVTSK